MLETVIARIDRGLQKNGHLIVAIDGRFASGKTTLVGNLRDHYDLKIFVDLMSDERLIRRVKRFMRDRGQTLDEVAVRYLDTVRYRHNEFVEPSRWHADLLFNGAAPLEKSCDIVLAYAGAKGV